MKKRLQKRNERSFLSPRVSALAVFFLSAGLLFSGETALFSAETPPPAKSPDQLFQDKISGDEAFAAKNYGIAASFYAKYRKEAADNQYIHAERDAYEREIDALILGRMPEPASKLLSEYELRFPGVNSLSVSMWQADILLLQKEAEKARVILERIFPGFTAQDPRRIRVMGSLAYAYELKKEYADAYKLYEMMRKEAKTRDPGTVRRAYERSMLTLFAANDLDAAEKSLLDLQIPETDRDRDVLRFFSLYLNLKRKGTPATDAVWSEIEKLHYETPDPILYALTSMIGDTFLQFGDTRKAVQAYKLAFGTATTRDESFETLNRLADLLEKLSPENAAEIALRQYELFRGPYSEPSTKFRIARIVAKSTQSLKSAAIYEEIFQDVRVEPATRLTALKEAIDVFVALNQYADAEKIIARYFKDQSDTGDADLLRAELLRKQKKFEKSGDAYFAVAQKYPAHYRDALYQAALAYLDAELFPKVIEIADQVIRNNTGPFRKDALYLRAMAYDRSNRHADAIRDYLQFAETAGKENPYTANAYYYAARLYFLDRDFQNAQTYFQKLVKEFPRHDLAACAHYWLIHCFYAKNDELAAEKETWILSEQYPDSEYTVAALLKLASFYADSGAPGKADSALDSLIQRNEFPEIQAKAMYEKALLAYRAREVDKASEWALKQMERFPENTGISETCYLMGDILRAKNDFEAAITWYQKAAERRPESPLGTAALGAAADCLFALASKSDSPERFEAALNLYDRLLKQDSLYPHFRAMLLYKKGRCLQLLGGRDDEALNSYKELIYQVQPDQVQSRPAETLWCVKAVEQVVNLAGIRPLSQNVEAAIFALNWLAGSGLQNDEVIHERIKQLNKKRFRP